MIKLKNIVKTYDSSRTNAYDALKDVSLQIERGEFVTIMGPSGAGKSSLINILGFLDIPTSGRYIFENNDVAQMSEIEHAKLRNAKLGFVFQDFNLIMKMSIYKNIELPMIYAGYPELERRSRTLELLEMVGFEESGDKTPNQLSGGEKQKVAIARALINRPAVLLADEPTGNLDSVSGEEIMALFQHVNRQGVTVVLITHDLNIAKHSKRVICIKDGMLTKDVKLPKWVDSRAVLKKMRKNKFFAT